MRQTISLIAHYKHISKYFVMIGQIIGFAWSANPLFFTCLTVLQILKGILPVGLAWIFKQIVDTLLSTGNSSSSFPRELYLLVGLQMGLLISIQIVNAWYEYCNTELTHFISYKAQKTVYSKIEQIDSLMPFENPQMYDIIRLAIQSGSSAPLQIMLLLSNSLGNTITLLSYWGILLTFSPLLLGLILFASIPQLYSQIRASKRQVTTWIKNSPKERRLAYFGDVLAGFRYVKETRLFGLTDYFLQAFLQTFREIHQTNKKNHIFELRWQVVLGTLFSVSMGISTVFIVFQVANHQLTLGDMTFYLTALTGIQMALSNIILGVSNLTGSVKYFEHMASLLTLPSLLPSLHTIFDVPELKFGIELRNVAFRYSENHPWVLHNLNLTILSGKCTALVGLNGAGKTTLVKLIARFYDPTEGEILWDGIDIRRFETKKLREHISAIFQDFVRYDLAAQENIGLGNIEHIQDIESIYEAAVNANIHSVISKLPQGYKTILSRWLNENGAGFDLSEGQWQKVAIARMLIRHAELLILDEPTSSLDPQAEQELFKLFDEVSTKGTSLLISHRFSTVQAADKIAVLSDGAIVEYGSHNALITLNGLYAQLYNTQADHYSKNYTFS